MRRAARSSLVRAAVHLASWLPLPVALWFGSLAGSLAWFLLAGERRLALEHLALAFPELPEEERRRIGRGSFVHLAQAAMEAVAVRRIDPRLAEYVELSPAGERLMKEAMAAGRGFVFVTGHVGNWELLARRIARAGIPPVVIARRAWDEKVDALIASFRASGGVPTLWREDAGSARALLRAMRDGKALGILIDQDTQVQGVFVPFFGRPAFTPRAAADLALRFRAPVFVGWSRRRGQAGQGYHLELEPVPYDPDAPDQESEAVRITAACTARLERVIRESPAEWVWMHRRWKTQPSTPPVS